MENPTKQLMRLFITLYLYTLILYCKQKMSENVRLWNNNRQSFYRFNFFV